MRIKTSNADWFVTHTWDRKISWGYKHFCIRLSTTYAGPILDLLIDFDHTTMYSDHVRMISLKLFCIYIEMYGYKGLH